MNSTHPWAGIAKLQEEMGELAAVLGKLHAYPSGVHPDEATNGDLLIRLTDELADVVAACTFFMETNLNDKQRIAIDARVTKKINTFRHWHHHEGMTGTKAK